MASKLKNEILEIAVGDDLDISSEIVLENDLESYQMI